VLLALSAATVSAPADEIPISDKAKAHFTAGVSYLQDPDGERYEEAYREFKAAYAESPSWKILGNLGITAMKLERYGEAIEAFGKYLAEGGTQLEEDERKQVQTDLSTLQSSVVYLTLESSPPGAAFVDQRIPVQGTPVVNRYEGKEGKLLIGVKPGQHRITAQLAGRKEAVWELDARSGTKEEHLFELGAIEPAAPEQPGPGSAAAGPEPRPAAMERPVPTSVYIGAAATGLFAIGATVTGVMALGKKGEFEDKNDGLHPEAGDLRDEGQQLNLIADILIGGAVVAGAVTTILFVGRPEVPAGQAARLELEPSIGPRGGGFSLRTRF
jgi:hypothetical protein